MNLNVNLPENWTQRHENINAWVLTDRPEREIILRSKTRGWDVYASASGAELQHVTTVARYDNGIYTSDAHIKLVLKHAVRELAHRIETSEPNITRTHVDSPVTTDDMAKETKANVTDVFGDIERYIADVYGIQHKNNIEATLTVCFANYTDVNPNIASVVVNIEGDDTPQYQTILYEQMVSEQTLTLQALLVGLKLASDADVDTVHIRLNPELDLVEQLQSISPNQYDVEYDGDEHPQLALSGGFTRLIKPFDFTIESVDGDTHELAQDVAEQFYDTLTTQHTEPYPTRVISDVVKSVSERPDETTTEETGVFA